MRIETTPKGDELLADLDIGEVLTMAHGRDVPGLRDLDRQHGDRVRFLPRRFRGFPRTPR